MRPGDTGLGHIRTGAGARFAQPFSIRQGQVKALVILGIAIFVGAQILTGWRRVRRLDGHVTIDANAQRPSGRADDRHRLPKDERGQQKQAQGRPWHPGGA